MHQLGACSICKSGERILESDILFGKVVSFCHKIALRPKVSEEKLVTKLFFVCHKNDRSVTSTEDLDLFLVTGLSQNFL